MLVMFEEGTQGGICQATYRYATASNKYMKNYDKNQESTFLVYDDANKLYGWSMCKKVPVSDFKWVDDLSIIVIDNCIKLVCNLQDKKTIQYMYQH